MATGTACLDMAVSLKPGIFLGAMAFQLILNGLAEGGVLTFSGHG